MDLIIYSLVCKSHLHVSEYLHIFYCNYIKNILSQPCGYDLLYF